MTYRDDVAALEARYEALGAELAQQTRARDEVARMLVEARARDANDRLAEDWAAGGPRRRRRRRILVIALSAVIALVAAGIVYRIAAAPPHVNEIDMALARMDRFADDLCKCRDATCQKHETDAMTAWGSEASKRWPTPPKLDDRQQKRVGELAQRLAKCMGRTFDP